MKMHDSQSHPPCHSQHAAEHGRGSKVNPLLPRLGTQLIAG